MASSLDEQSEDLSTCCVCMEPYDDEILKPKSLPCLHTFCLQCAKRMICAPTFRVNCPVCKVAYTQRGGAESLPTNMFALHILNLKKSQTNGFSTELVANGLQSWDLLGSTKTHFNIEFSDDETLIVAGAYDNRLLLWHTEELFGKKRNLEPTVLSNKKPIFCLAVSPANDRILTGGSSQVSIFDIERNKLVSTIPHDCSVTGISLQPGSNGKVFASVCENSLGTICVYDVRNDSRPKLVDKKALDSFEEMMDPCTLHSIMFSPTDSNVVAVTGGDTLELFDIRDLEECLHSFTLPKGSFSENARFNKKGTRLLCSLSGSSPAVFDLPKFPDLADVEQEPTRLIGPGYNSKEGTEGLCFAGKDDEMAVVASTDNDIYIWSVPEGQQKQSKIGKPLLILRVNKDCIGGIRYSAKHCVLASTGFDVIKFWTTEKHN